MRSDTFKDAGVPAKYKILSALAIFVAAMKIQIEGMGIVKDLICHCFEYSVDDINQDYLENCKSTIMEKIQMEKKFGNCQCATKNPKGK